MPLFTREQFTKVANLRAGTKTFSRIVNESRSESSTGKTSSVFLSHCHTDKSLVSEAVAFFKGMNINIYVDWMDESMPEKTNGITAQKIKQKIILNDKFVLLATNDAVSSKWCNWELGISDTFKLTKDKMVILPLADNRGNWLGNEYLQIYPRVEPVQKDNYSFHENIFKIYYPDNSSKWLDDWLKT
ncbi:MAG: toll/interleukin-1 receptor domain-containing protein [Chitinophagaceae bacterium]|nr:toll/interleukin-1 receptor domain-containing protein [Chitinophagaceae bacterium]